LTLTNATRLRQQYATGKYRQRDLAFRADCSTALMSLILSNRAYPDPDYRPVRRYHARAGKLTSVSVSEVRRARARGRTLADIGKHYGVTRQAVASYLRSAQP
jgi:transcriptional regulator with XRE-family HTH domain